VRGGAGVARNDDHEAVAGDGALEEIWLLDLAFDQAELSVPGLDRPRDTEGVRHRDMANDPRMLGPKADQPPRQPIAGDGLAGVDLQAAALKPRKLRECELRRGDPIQHRRASARNRRPVSVRAMPRPIRSNISTPCSASSARTAALTVDWVRLSASAARVTCSRSETATKMRS
jgi:hypothetical protein